MRSPACVLFAAVGLYGCAAPAAVGETERRTATVRGDFEVAYSVWARGAVPGATPVVFVHGWACDQTSWDGQVTGDDLPAALRARPRIAVDLPGHGHSRMPSSGRLSADLFAEAIAAVLDREQVRQAVLVGHSNGVPVVRHFSRRYPERTAALVAVDGPLKSFFVDVAQAQTIFERLGDEKYARAMVEGMLGTTMPAERRTRIVAMMMATPPDARASAFRATVDPAIWTDDPIRVPLLMVNAKQPAWNEEYLAYVRRLAPQVEYHEWVGVTHFLMMDDPAKFNAVVAAFIDQHGF